MADIRINALATTATTPASDDYLALDGAAQGTRKILATNIANNVTDVILGTSGPSVKSTLSARAPRQGLVFDGTFGASFSGVPAFGTGDFTVSAWINPSALATVGIIAGGTSSFSLRFQSNGTLNVGKVNVSDGTPSTGVVSAGKFSHVSYVKSGSTGTYYINGISSGTSSETGLDYSAATTLVGAYSSSTTQVFSGTISGGLIYNRALSASELVALYEAGAPAGADYNSASNTGIITGQNNTFNGGIGNWTSGGTGTVAAGTNVMNCTAGSTADNLAGYLTFVNAGYNPKGYYVRVTADITNNSGTVRIGVGRAVLTQIGSLAGNGTFDATAFLPATTDADSFWICGATSSQTFTVDNFQVFRLGLLLAPDAAQAGGGLVWYDTSGNAANISWTSGVSWNVPSSSYWGGQLKLQNTTGTNGLRINNISSDTFGFFGGGNDGLPVFSSLNNTSISAATYGWLAFNSSATGDFELYRRNNSTTNAAALIVARSTGNLIVGGAAGSDGGQKLQVSGTAYVSGNTLFGGNLTVGSATTPKGKIDAQAAYDGSAPSTSSTPIIRANNGGAISLWMGGNAYSYMWMQAIQDDGSNNIKNINFQPLGGDVNFGGNATFAGDVFSTKSINIASGYSLTAQDSGNTYRTILRGIADNTVEIGWGTATPTNGHLIFKAGGTEQGRINPAGGWILGLTASAPVLGTNSTMTFELTSNTSLTIKVRGTDGTTRSATLTLS